MKHRDKITTERIVEEQRMNDSAFEFATRGLRLAAQTKEAARLIRVKGISRSEAMKATGVSSDTLSKALTRIRDNLQIQLAEGRLVHGDWILPPELAEGLSAVEARVLEPFLKNKKPKKKKTGK